MESFVSPVVPYASSLRTAFTHCAPRRHEAHAELCKPVRPHCQHSKVRGELSSTASVRAHSQASVVSRVCRASPSREHSSERMQPRVSFCIGKIFSNISLMSVSSRYSEITNLLQVSHRRTSSVAAAFGQSSISIQKNFQLNGSQPLGLAISESRDGRHPQLHTSASSSTSRAIPRREQ